MAKKRTIVGSPLTPSVLSELDAVDRFPSTPGDFDPAGNWVNAYRIWTCHGYRESGNENVGFLRIERTAGSGRQSGLTIHQEVVQTDGIVSVIDGRIRCRNDRLASLVQWSLSSRFKGSEGRDLAELASRREGAAEETGGRTTGDWCLFEAVQRLAFDRQEALSFDLLEGLSLSKPGQRLSYRGVSPMKVGDEKMSLHCFAQLGRGLLPCEYWLDVHHRLLAVISMNKAYILDDQAEKASR